MKQIILTLVFSVATAINSFAGDWGKADIGAFEDYGNDCDSPWIWLIIIGVLLLGAFIKGMIDGKKG